MNARKGIKRLSAFLVGLYFAFWAVMAWWGYHSANLALSGLKLHPYGDPENIYWAQSMEDASWWTVKSVHFGLFPALGLIVLSPILFWVYRGFFPKVAK